MVARRRLRKSRAGGARKGAGRKPGGTTEARRVARAQAARSGMLPDELLLEWARTGEMLDAKGKKVQLSPADRIACAKGCASYYKHPLAASKPQDEPAQPVVLTLDEKALRALSMGQQQALMEFFQLVQRGGDLSKLSPTSTGADPEAYRKSLN